MKIVFLVCNEVFTSRVMEMLNGSGIDYYTRWEEVKGKGHGMNFSKLPVLPSLMLRELNLCLVSSHILRTMFCHF